MVGLQCETPYNSPPALCPSSVNCSQVTVASVEDSLEVVCARQTKLVADKSISECTGESWDLIALPVGGWAAGAGWGDDSWNL